MTKITSTTKHRIDSRYSLLAAVDFCGSLTTMSSLALDTSNLLDDAHYGPLIAGKNLLSFGSQFLVIRAIIFVNF